MFVCNNGVMCLIKILRRTAFPQRSAQNSIEISVAGRRQVRRPAQDSGPENCAELRGFDFPDVSCLLVPIKGFSKSSNLLFDSCLHHVHPKLLSFRGFDS